MSSQGSFRKKVVTYSRRSVKRASSGLSNQAWPTSLFPTDGESVGMSSKSPASRSLGPSRKGSPVSDPFAFTLEEQDSPPKRKRSRLLPIGVGQPSKEKLDELVSEDETITFEWEERVRSEKRRKILPSTAASKKEAIPSRSNSPRSPPSPPVRRSPRKAKSASTPETKTHSDPPSESTPHTLSKGSQSSLASVYGTPVESPSTKRSKSSATQSRNNGRGVDEQYTEEATPSKRRQLHKPTPDPRSFPNISKAHFGTDSPTEAGVEDGGLLLGGVSNPLSTIGEDSGPFSYSAPSPANNEHLRRGSGLLRTIGAPSLPHAKSDVSSNRCHATSPSPLKKSVSAPPFSILDDISALLPDISGPTAMRALSFSGDASNGPLRGDSPRATRRVARMKTSGKPPGTPTRRTSVDMDTDPSAFLSQSHILNTLNGPVNLLESSVPELVLHPDDLSNQPISSVTEKRVLYSSLSIETSVGDETYVKRAMTGMTYARTRSYIESEEDLFAPKFVSDAQRRKDEGLESSDDEEDRREVKGIHELREAGEAKRFADEMEYIMGGFGPEEPAGVKRSSCLRLCTKVLSEKFVQNVKAHGFFARFMDFVRAIEDPILITMVTFILCALVQNRRNVDDLSQDPALIQHFAKALRLNPDPLIGGASKYERRFIADLKKTLRCAPFIPNIEVESLESLSIRAISAIIAAKPLNVPRLQYQLWENGVGLLISQRMATFLRVANSVAEEGSDESIISSFEKLWYSESSLTVASLRILQFATMRCGDDAVALLETAGFLNELMASLAWLTVYARADETHVQEASILLHAMLALLINLTHASTTCAESIARGPWLGSIFKCGFLPNDLLPTLENSPVGSAIPEWNAEHDTRGKETPEEKTDSFAIMMLGIALLANVAHKRPQLQKHLRSYEFSLTCPSRLPCMQRCTCASRQVAVKCIADFINERLAKDSEEANSAMVTGQATMVLGLLIQHDSKSWALAKSSMTHHQQSFGAVIEMLENFRRLYDALAMAAPGNPSCNPTTPITPMSGVSFTGADSGFMGSDTSGMVAELIKVFRGA
ncbi:wings apart-like protein regulation of heterochromatin-domain-containing protein [Fimicolochytrium jonesii]|uniref:wings apart-like protein regulation of heterochromatin-domain-containing protein n=1 Tax=Fimicolochytrium jonesii TaxID=1396493 RepID=UPI0022FEA51E|nr:wings apart-like protein regulation of heterochromatin-domain-containing protein [Fimicolochytrium jonesii]KAI8820777.1 wings apart-like protein regulation of heterochromatin-domain-containing protein [Fimicolochytrium jonesii]